VNRRLFPWLVVLFSAGCQQQPWTPLVDATAQSGVTESPPKESAESADIPVQDATTDRLSGKVIRVIDGDTLVLLVEGEQGKPEEVRVRLEGIDCPESGQPWSKRAKQELSDLVLNQTAKVWTIGEDRYGRKLGRVYVGTDDKPLDVNITLVARGLAWHFKRYSDDEDLAEAEIAARRERKGLWADPSPVAPWDWRERQREGDNTPAVSTPSEAVTGYWLNTSSGVRHNSGCRELRQDETWAPVRTR
jgi:micrococcal nuclease